MKTFYVIYRGVGRDGGFGDYAGAYWDDDPVMVDNQIVWLQSAEDANNAVEELNERAAKAFYDAGNGESYSGEFPVEYEYRKIQVPNSGPVSIKKALDLITKQDEKSWPEGDF